MAPCEHVYIDVGTNIGTQVHKLYNPASCPSPVQALFAAFPRNRLKVCTVAVEPNPRHRMHLEKVRQAYEDQGAHVRVFHALAGTKSGRNTSFFLNQEYLGGKSHDDWTGSEFQRHDGQVAHSVPSIDLAEMITTHTQGARTVIMKLDVEGSETSLLPHIQKLLCYMKHVYVELHNAPARTQFNLVKRILANDRCPVHLHELDDEIPCKPDTIHELHHPALLSMVQRRTDLMPDVCVYPYGTNTILGKFRMERLKTNLDSQGIPYVSFTGVKVRSYDWNVPCLIGRDGYIGMWLTMHRIWSHAMRTCHSPWVVLLEADAVPTHSFKMALHSLQHLQDDVVWMDERTGKGPGPSGCCTVAVAYHKTRALPTLISNFDPTNTRNALWNNYSARKNLLVQHETCLTDWYLANVVKETHLRASRNGIVAHPAGRSEIHEAQHTL